MGVFLRSYFKIVTDFKLHLLGCSNDHKSLKDINVLLSCRTLIIKKQLGSN